MKQVPASSEVEIDPETGNLKRSTGDTRTNPYDLFALEVGLSLKEQMGGTVTCLTMGPMQAKSMMMDAYAMGADEAVILSDRKFAGADVLATSYTLSQGIELIGRANPRETDAQDPALSQGDATTRAASANAKQARTHQPNQSTAPIGDVDIIICGRQTTDGDTAQVGPALAEHLGIPHAAWVSEIVSVENDRIQVRQDLSTVSQVSEIPFPCLITVDKDMCVPRLPSFKLKKATENRNVRVITMDDLPNQDLSRYGLIGSPTSVEQMFAPPEAQKQVRIEGESGREKADNLFAMLVNQKVL